MPAWPRQCRVRAEPRRGRAEPRATVTASTGQWLEGLGYPGRRAARRPVSDPAGGATRHGGLQASAAGPRLRLAPSRNRTCQCTYRFTPPPANRCGGLGDRRRAARAARSWGCGGAAAIARRRLPAPSQPSGSASLGGAVGAGAGGNRVQPGARPVGGPGVSWEEGRGSAGPEQREAWGEGCAGGWPRVHASGPAPTGGRDGARRAAAPAARCAAASPTASGHSCLGRWRGWFGRIPSRPGCRGGGPAHLVPRCRRPRGPARIRRLRSSSVKPWERAAALRAPTCPPRAESMAA